METVHPKGCEGCTKIAQIPICSSATVSRLLICIIQTVSKSNSIPLKRSDDISRYKKTNPKTNKQKKLTQGNIQVLFLSLNSIHNEYLSFCLQGPSMCCLIYEDFSRFVYTLAVTVWGHFYLV